MGKTVMHEVWVCDKITDLIIGVDFIQIHKLAYDCTSRSVHWNNEPHAPVLTLREETTFEPLTTTLISTKFLGKFEKNTTQIVSIFSIEDEFIQGGPALVYVSDSGLCTVAVTNCAPYPIQLKRGSVIGLIQDECCAQDEIEPLSDTKVTEIFESINLICAHATSSHKWTRDDIASKIQLNVPTEFRSKYLNLLFKHRDALSTSKTDLGKAKTFFHKIHLKDNNPVYRKQFKIPEAHSDFISKTIDDWLNLVWFAGRHPCTILQFFVFLKRTVLD